MRALLIDSGFTEAGLAAVWELGKAGWTVGVGSPGGRGYAASSRWCSKRHDIPSQMANVEAFIERIADVVRVEGYEIVFSTSDSATLSISKYRRELPCVVPYADHSDVERAFDKLELARSCQEAGLCVPETIAARPADCPPSFPIIIKPRLHWNQSGSGRVSRIEATIASNQTEVNAAVSEMLEAGAQPVFQQFVTGRLSGFQTVSTRNGNPVARMQQISERTWRRAVGRPTKIETVPIDRELSTKVENLLKSLKWFGLVQIQFIVAPDGKWYMIDFNGRAYMSLALAHAAGLNFHDTWGRLALNLPCSPLPTAAADGLRFQCLEQDLLSALFEPSSSVVGDLLHTSKYAISATHPFINFNDIQPLGLYWFFLMRRIRAKFFPVMLWGNRTPQ